MNTECSDFRANNVVLLVDDQDNIRMNLKQWLERSHYDVHTAKTIAEAEEIIDSEKINFAIVDLKLDFRSDYGGVEIIKRVKAKHPESKVIVLTAYDFTDEIKKEIDGRYDDFVCKGSPKNYIKAVLDTLKKINPGFFEQAAEKEAKKEIQHDIPGFKLAFKLTGHLEPITKVCWSPDGSKIASGATDNSIRIWNAQTGVCERSIEAAHAEWIWCISWSPQGNQLASASEDGTIYIWDPLKGERLKILVSAGKPVYTLSWSYDGKLLASGGYDGRLHVWKTENWARLHTLPCSSFGINCLIWSPINHVIASGGYDQVIRLWDGKDGKLLHTYSGHNGSVNSIAWSPDAKELASGGDDRIVKVWNTLSKRLLWNIEGHTAIITEVSYSSDGRFLSSRSRDCTVMCWMRDPWTEVALIGEQGCGKPSIDWHAGISFNPEKPILATLGKADTDILLWEADFDKLKHLKESTNAVTYTTARIVLVGDSGVGKTGLGYRMAYKVFKEHPSTHGMYVWLLDDLKNTRPDGTECEVLLWDTAGQHTYRSVNAIFLDKLDVALVVFDPTNRTEPLKGVEFWLEHLSGKQTLPPTVLIGARVDRGASALSTGELKDFCEHNKISGGYVSTSARKNDGIDPLINLLRMQIPWDNLTTTVTTDTFKRIKQSILAWKESIRKENREDEWKGVLASPEDLYRYFKAEYPAWEFSIKEMMDGVKNLENHGHVMVLQSVSGAETILLYPDLLPTLASSIILEASNHPQKLGALNEDDLLQNHYNFPELKRLNLQEQTIMIDATVYCLLEHNICFREAYGEDILFIFPGLVKQKRPRLDQAQTIDDATYIVHGAVENVYPALVVLIGYTPFFARINQWQNDVQYLAQFESSAGEICGFRLTEDLEGEIQLTLYYGDTTSQHHRTLFQGLFEKFLYQRNVEVIRYPPVSCSNFHHQERSLIIKHLREEKKFIFCHECGEKIILPEVKKPRLLGGEDYTKISRAEESARIRNLYEKYLLTVKGFLRKKPSPVCYISYLDAPIQWIDDLIDDLRKAGVNVQENRNELKMDGYIIVICTPKYKYSWENDIEPIASDAVIIKSRIRSSAKQSLFIIPLLLRGDFDDSCPDEIREFNAGNFSDQAYYWFGLFELVLTLYSIPLNHDFFKLKLEKLRDLCKVSKVDVISERNKIFVSYAHHDKRWLEQLHDHLKAMENESFDLDLWDDTRIKPGMNWKEEIQKALFSSRAAILLVSTKFLASDFIREYELPVLLEGALNKGVTILPVILDFCRFRNHKRISQFQSINDPKSPLQKLNKNKRNEIFVNLTNRIEELLNPEA